MAVGVGFIGPVVLLRPGAIALLWAGVLLLAALIEASGEIGSQRLRQPPDAVLATGWQLAGAGVTLLAAGGLHGEYPKVAWSAMGAQTIRGFAFLVVPGSLMAYVAFVWLLATSPVQLVATYAYVNPVGSWKRSARWWWSGGGRRRGST